MKAMKAFKAMPASPPVKDAPKAMAASPTMKKKFPKSAWPGWKRVSVGGGMETIWVKPGVVLHCGYNGAMFRVKVRKDLQVNKWVKVEDKKDKKVKKTRRSKGSKAQAASP